MSLYKPIWTAPKWKSGFDFFIPNNKIVKNISNMRYKHSISGAILSEKITYLQGDFRKVHDYEFFFVYMRIKWEKRFTYKKVDGIYHVYDSTKDNKLVKRFKTLTKLATFLMLNGQDS